ncbi:MAG: TSUP family transporter [Alphaproteobacteria bacterium]|nr:TSUP family transporter [Alphaproteobacteria bacterium]
MEALEFLARHLGEDFWIYILIGFCAQIIDGALGMAYGVISSSFLMTMGVPPAVASASIHAAEFVTTGMSASAHAYFGNIDKKLFIRLAIFGSLGGIAGAVFLSNVPVEFIQPVISVYLLLIGIYIFYRAFVKKPVRQITNYKFIPPLGFAGGALDAMGGGGWGPIVTSKLLAGGGAPRLVIGSVNAAEFFVTGAVTAAFVFSIGFHFHKVAVGLLIGGAVAAPLAALMVAKFKGRILMTIAALAIIVTSVIRLGTFYTNQHAQLIAGHAEGQLQNTAEICLKNVDVADAGAAIEALRRCVYESTYVEEGLFEKLLASRELSFRKVTGFVHAENYPSYSFIEVLNPDTQKWEIHDVNYNVYYRGGEGNEKLGTRRVFLAGFENVKACRTDKNEKENCGWKMPAKEGAVTGDVQKYWGAAVIQDPRTKTNTLHVRPEGFNLDKPELVNGVEKTFCQFEEKFCTDIVIHEAKQTP